MTGAGGHVAFGLSRLDSVAPGEQHAVTRELDGKSLSGSHGGEQAVNVHDPARAHVDQRPRRPEPNDAAVAEDVGAHTNSACAGAAGGSM